MQRQIIVVFASLFWLVLAPAWSADRGALFKVTGNGHTMHLFGTMHVGLAEFYPLEPRIVQAVAAASTLALELDLDVAPAAAARALQEYGMAAPGAALPPALAARLAPLLQRAGMNPAAIAQFKPWVVAMVLSLHEVAALGYRADLAVDSHLARLARAGKAKVVELESVGLQMGLFNKLSDADQLRYLDETITAMESGKQRAELREIVDAWRTADQPALEAIVARVESDTSFVGRFAREVLMDGRNGAMADKLVALLARENNTVAAVGLLHLLGKNGVPALMRARGITVERVY